MSQKDVSAIQRAKYRLLRHLPGPRGQHYARKHRRARWRETEALFASDQLERIDYIFCETHEPELPHMLDRYKALRVRASASLRPVINLDWQ